MKYSVFNQRLMTLLNAIVPCRGLENTAIKTLYDNRDDKVALQESKRIIHPKFQKSKI